VPRQIRGLFLVKIPKTIMRAKIPTSLYVIFIALIASADCFQLQRQSRTVRCNKRTGQTLQMMDLPLMVDSSYNLAAGCAVIGTACGVLENFKGPTGKLFGGGAIAFTVFAAFIAFQTTTLRFQFDDTSFSLVKADGQSNGKNIVVGGENSWKYNTFVNYDFLPSEEFPILVYFKETQTPKQNWVEVPIVVDKAAGQGHFFPAIANTAQLKAAFESNKCAKL
jgi:Protein of unknown function (DUF3119)